jgi:hypothetical protein
MMTLTLTDQQHEQVRLAQGFVAEVIDPRTQRRYVLLPVEEFEMLKDREEQSRLRTTAGRALARRLAGGKSEIRSSKFETNSKDQIQRLQTPSGRRFGF